MQVGHAMSGCHGLARAMQLAKEQGVKTRAVAVLVPHENVGQRSTVNPVCPIGQPVSGTGEHM